MTDQLREGPPQHQEPHSQWEVRKSEMYQGLDRKVGVLVGIKKSLDTISADDSPDSVKGRLQGMFTQVTATLPPEILHKVKRYNELEKERERLEDALTENREDEQNMDAIFSVDEERAGLIRDNDVLFAVQFEKFINNLVKKNEQVTALKENPEKLRQEVEEATESKPDWDDLDRTVYSPFSISFVWGKDFRVEDILSRKKVGGGVLGSAEGLHFPHSPFNFIHNRLSPDEVDHTILHEDIHNLLEATGVIRSNMQPEQKIMRRIKRFEEALKSGMPMVGPYNPRTLLIEAISPQAVINGQHEEILTELQILEKQGFDYSRGVSAAQKKFAGRERGRLTDIDALGIYSTGGNQISEVLRLLKKTAREHEGDQLGEICDQAEQVNRKTWLAIVTDLRDTLGIAKRLGPEAHLEVHTLYYLLKPTQFHHAKGYLEHKYGKEQVTRTETTMKVVQAFRLDSGTIDEQVAQLNAMGDRLTPADREELKTKLDRATEDFEDVAEIGIQSIEGGRAFVAKLDALKAVFPDGEFVDQVKHRIFGETLFTEIRNTFVDDAQRIPEIYDSLPPDEQNIFQYQMRVYVDSTITADLYAKYGRNLRYSDVQNLPEWELFERFGVQQNLEEAFRREEEFKRRMST